MQDSRCISKFMKHTEKGYFSVEFLDWCNINTFDFLNNGKIGTTPFGTNSCITIRIIGNTHGSEATIVDYKIHPNRLLVIADMLSSNQLDFLKAPSCETNKLRGFINKKIYKTDKKPGTNIYTACYTNMYINDDGDFVFFNKVGVAPLCKTDTNTNSFNLNEFKKQSGNGIVVPFVDALILFTELKMFVTNFYSVSFSAMLSGRLEYEKKCKNEYKYCKGNLKKIVELEQKKLGKYKEAQPKTKEVKSTTKEVQPKTKEVQPKTKKKQPNDTQPKNEFEEEFEEDLDYLNYLEGMGSSESNSEDF